MTFARAANLPRGLGRAAWRRAGSSSRRSWRQVGRRGYASDHGHGSQQTSELPWIIGSIAITVPSAAWLLQQTPKTGGHGHGHDSHGEEHEEKQEEEQPEEEESKEEEEPKEEEPKEENKEEEQPEAQDESKEEGEDEQKGGNEKSDDDQYEKPGADAPKQINWDSSSKKGPGEQQKGERAPSEKKGEKDSKGDHSGAKHPYLDDAEKSKKGAGMTETAKIHGTVDSRQGARGVGATGEGSS